MSRNRRRTNLFGLKWNPFVADVSSEALLRTPQVDLFLSRVESLLDTGGFALITGDSGTGKSVTLRLLAEHLSALRDTVVGVVNRPQSVVTDFYRELGHLFGVPLSPHNRWATTGRCARDGSPISTPPSCVPSCALLTRPSSLPPRSSRRSGS